MSIAYQTAKTNQAAIIHNTQAGLEYLKNLSKVEFNQAISSVSLSIIQDEQSCPCPECKLKALCGLIGIATLAAARELES